MKFTFCPHCGTKAIKKEIGDEGMIPYCASCEIPLWDMFTTSIITAVTNEHNEVALLRQNYVTTTSYVCVAGIMKLGESAEDAVAREVYEEIGQRAAEIHFVRSYPYEKKEMLMLGFHTKVKKKELELSQEVDAAEWIPFSEALGKLREGSIAWQLVKEIIQKV